MTDTDNSVATSSAVNNAIDLNYGYFIGDSSSLGPFDNAAAVVDNVKPLTSTGVPLLNDQYLGVVGEENNLNLNRTQPLLSEEGGGAPANSKTEQESDSTNSSNSNSGSSSSSSSSSSSGSNEHMEHVIKLRGLPWSCTKDDIIDFLGSECRIYGDADGIHMITTPEGKASGEALVELASDDDLVAALKKDKRNMGHRYIEVFKITRNEMEWVLKRSRPVFSSNNGSFPSGGGRANGSNSETFVRLRGLPYECTTEDIHNFFHGLEIVSNGILLMVDGMGRSSGEAYVQFATKDQAQKALGKDREMIKHRYVEIFVVSPTEAKNMQSMVSRVGRSSALNTRSGPYDRPNNRGSDSSRYGGGGRQSQSKYFNKGFENDTWNNYDCWGSGGNNARSSNMNPPPLIPGLKRSRELDGNTRHCVLMRGLPYRADESDIRRFFSPLNPTAVHIIYESSGRPSGTAKVNFASNDDVTRAMAKHKDRMEHRYIELFVHRT